MIEIDEILSKVKEYNPHADVALIRSAYEFANDSHKGQKRVSGDLYITHPLSVAEIITRLRLDVPSICAGLLHDAVEDTSATTKDIEDRFGAEVAFLVDGVTKLGKISYYTKEELQSESFRKMLLAMVRDIRVILVKFCDRFDNMQTLHHLPREKQERIAKETMEIYAPLAQRLGIDWMKHQLENMAFRYLYPGEYELLQKEQVQHARREQRYILGIERSISKMMKRNDIDCRVFGKIKNQWSIRNQMKRTGRSYEDIENKIGFYVITKKSHFCYQALGVIHAMWTPVPGSFKDYIALPKPNMYQALHTLVVGKDGKRLKLQIQTEEMYLIGEHGIAADWHHKEGKATIISTKNSKKLAWLRQLTETQEETNDPIEFIESIKEDLFSEEVHVFTPQGDVKALPEGSTPIDFAYMVHSLVGDTCSGARVNGMVVPLRYCLRSGDTVEIITLPKQKPNIGWLRLVKTAHARTKIRQSIRREQRDKALVLGKKILERALKQYGWSIAKAEKDGSLDNVLTSLGHDNVTNMLMAIGYGKITTSQVIEIIVPSQDQVKTKEQSDSKTGPMHNILKHTPFTSDKSIKIGDQNNSMVRLAMCCNPLPGDKIIGTMTMGRGVAVHHTQCPTALDLDPTRRVPVEWDSNDKTEYRVVVEVISSNKPGLLASISQAFTKSSVNIYKASCVATTDRTRATNTFHAMVRHISQLHDVTETLSRIDGVYSTRRVNTQKS